MLRAKAGSEVLCVHKDAVERVRPAAAAGHADLRGGQGAVHGDRRRLAVAQGGRGQVPLSLLGPGGALDGLPAEHGQGRDDAALLRARPAEDEPDARRSTPTSWTEAASRSTAATSRRGSRPRRARPRSSGSRSAGDEWGVFTGRFTAEEPGKHEVTLFCKQTGATLETHVLRPGRRGRAARPAGAAGGAGGARPGDRAARSSRPSKLDEVVRSLAELPEPPPSVRRRPALEPPGARRRRWSRCWGFSGWAGRSIGLV